MLGQSLELSGRWELYINFEQPAETPQQLPNRGWVPVSVPGCWEQVTENRQADGPVWYRKEFDLPKSWRGQPVAIEFEGVNYYCEVWLNGRFAGSHEGGWSGFRIDASGHAEAGSRNVLLLKVYKQGERFPLRQCLAGFLPDVGVIFGGIWKPVRIGTVPSCELADVFVTAEPDERKVQVAYELSAAPDGHVLHVEIFAPDGSRAAQSRTALSPDERTGSVTLCLDGDIRLWSLDSPSLYRAECRVEKNGDVIDAMSRRFGMRRFEIDGTRLLLNGKPVYLRGILHWGWYPQHIAPKPAREEIRKELQRIKDLGFNLVKHCLYVPVKDYFELADEMGVLIWQELPMWLPEVTPEFKRRVFTQYESIIREIRQHPSICLWTLGCELNGAVDSPFLENLYRLAKEWTGGAIIRDNSGSGECYGGLLNEFADFYDYHFYTDVHFYPDLLSRFAGAWRPRKPWLFGEFCDYDEYRDLKRTIELYGGKTPWWLSQDPVRNPVVKDERVQYSRQAEKMAALKLPFSDDELVRNSRRSALVYRKHVLELVRTYPNITGYVVTSIKDTPLATSAMFDDGDRPKQKAETFRPFNQDTVISLTWDSRRDWVNGGDRLISWDPYNYLGGGVLRPHVFVSHYGKEPIEGEFRWSLAKEDKGETLAEGAFRAELAPGEAKEIGVIEAAFPPCSEPYRLALRVWFGGDAFLLNEWTFTVLPQASLSEAMQRRVFLDDPLGLFDGLRQIYPCAAAARTPGALDAQEKAEFENGESTLIITSLYRREHEELLQRGHHVLFLQRGKAPFTVKKAPFWRESHQLAYDHPVMNSFPHGNHTSLLWYGLATDLVFDRTKLSGIVPLLDRLDARKFDLDTYMFEKRIGRGILIATTLRFDGGLGAQPSGLVRNPAGRYLLELIIKRVLGSLKEDADHVGLQHIG